MTSGKMAWGLATLALVLSGCQNGTGAYKTVRLPLDDYDRTFEVTREVLSRDFVVEQADRSTGRIVTAPKEVSEPAGAAGVVFGLPGSVRRVRRTATARLKRVKGSVLVSVRVQLETAEAIQSSPRPTYSEYDATATGADAGLDRAPERKPGLIWKRIGSDEEMERKLLAEIERRLRGSAPRPESSKEVPKKTDSP